MFQRKGAQDCSYIVVRQSGQRRSCKCLDFEFDSVKGEERVFEWAVSLFADMLNQIVSSLKDTTSSLCREKHIVLSLEYKAKCSVLSGTGEGIW